MAWYKDWFNSPFYHIMYKHRNDEEAKLFINNLLALLQPSKDAFFLDLACGKGRHSIYLNSLGYNITGIDLSENSIAEANKSSNSRLHFNVHDMRNVFKENTFDIVLNLFTSFGYFDTDKENNATIKAASSNLKSNGWLVIDFLNSKKITPSLLCEENKSIDGIRFCTNKKIKNKFIVKTIKFTHEGADYNFEERVKALTLNDFERYFKVNQLKIVNLFGDYQLNDFDEKKSERLILVAKKEI